MKKIIIANWKMNPTTGKEAKKWFQSINKVATTLSNVQTVICPPTIYLESLGSLVTHRANVLGAQDVFWESAGAFTGNISAEMLFNTKTRYVLLGHSERRALGETDEIIFKKIKNLLQFPLIPVLCVGESSRDEEGVYLQEIKKQITSIVEKLSQEEIMRIVVAYEPIWAIGEKAKAVCTPKECLEIVQSIRQVLADKLDSSNKAQTIPILYGGSVHVENAESFITEGSANGLLIGRASLDPKIFGKIIKSIEKLTLKK